MKQKLLCVLALVAIVFAAHWPALQADFVWDDTALVLRDPLIRSWRQLPEQFQHFLFTDATPSNFYRPIQRATYTVDYALGVFRPWVYHLSSLLIHAAAAIALFYFALALMESFAIREKHRLPLAFLATAAWALHPLHSAVVDYVSGRADSLAAFFGFLALTFVLRLSENEANRTWKNYLGASLCLLLGALSKESGLAFGAAALALTLPRWHWHVVGRVVLVNICVATIYLVLRAQAGDATVPQLSKPAPALDRPIIAARALAEYAGLFIFPSNLHMDREVESYPWGLNPDSLTATSKQELITLAGVLVALGLCWWLWRTSRNARPVFALLLVALITYLPIAGLWPLNATMAEHWIYVPSAFVLLAIALQLAPLLENRALARIACTLGLGWILGLGGRTLVRAGDWHDARTFFTRTISAGGDSPRMLVNLGDVELSERHNAAAKGYFARALKKNPEQPFAILNMAAVSLRENNYPEAQRWLERAQKNEITAASANEMLAILTYKEKATVDLLRLRIAAHSDPSSWEIERRYISTLAESGRYDRAIHELKGVLTTESYRAESWKMLAIYLNRTGQGRAAVDALAQACDLDVHLTEHKSL